MEEWKWIEGYEGRYEVSNHGRVRSLVGRAPRLIVGGTSGNGYLGVSLSRGGNKKRQYYIHRLVAQTYISNPSNHKTVNHKDGDKKNNCVSNLEWCTHQQNLLHAIATGLIADQKGAGNYAGKLTDEKVRSIRSKYRPRQYSMYRLAREFGVSPATICLVVQRKYWSHIQ